MARRVRTVRSIQTATAPPAFMTATTSGTDLWPARWQRFSAAAVRAYHGYANWLVGISWRRFIVLALGLMIVVGIVHNSPPLRGCKQATQLRH